MIQAYAESTGMSSILLPFVGSYDEHLYAFNAVTGQVLWNKGLEGIILSSPTVVNGMVFVGSDDGSLCAFGLPTSDLP
jgi:outer membrane protein assembly factor BamB